MFQADGAIPLENPRGAQRISHALRLDDGSQRSLTDARTAHAVQGCLHQAVGWSGHEKQNTDLVPHLMVHCKPSQVQFN